MKKNKYDIVDISKRYNTPDGRAEWLRMVADLIKIYGIPNERVQWLREVAWNLVNGTGKYDRFSVSKSLTNDEFNLLLLFDIEECKRMTEESNGEIEKLDLEIKKLERENEELQRKNERRKASSSFKHPFLIGEA